MKFIFTFFTIINVAYGLAQENKQYTTWQESLSDGSQYANQQLFNDAEEHLSRAYEIAKLIFENPSEELSTTAYYYGITEASLEHYQNAQQPLEIAADGFQKIMGDNSQEYAACLSYLGATYLENEIYDKAESCYIKSTEISKNIFGENHYNYGVALTNLAGYYNDISNFNKALEILNKGLEILKDNPEFPQQYYDNLRYNNLPNIYKGLGRFQDALEIEKASLEYIDSSYGKITSNYANILTSIGDIYINLGQFQKAKKTLISAVEIFESLDNEKDNEALGNSHMGLVVCYTSISDYENALIHANKGIELTQLKTEKLPKNRISYYNILGNLFYELGQFGIAKEFLEDAVNETIKVMGAKAPQLPVYKSNLGTVLWAYGDAEAAKTILNEALELAKALNYSVNDNEYRTCISNMLPVLIDEGRYKEAIAIVKDNLNQGNKLLPKYWSDVANLADIYLLNKQCDKALKLLNESLQPIEKFYGKQHPNYIRVVNNIILAKHCLNKYGNLFNTIKNANDLTKNRIQSVFSFSPENQKEVFLYQLQSAFDIYQSVNYNTPDDTNLTVLNLENQLMLKGLLLNTSRDIISKLSNQENPQILKTLNDYAESKQLLARLENGTKQLNADIISDLHSVVFKLEVELVKIYNDFVKDSFDFNKSWKKIQSALKANEVAIEFSQFTYYDNSETNDIYYLAYIIKKDTKYPQVVKLFKEQQLTAIFDATDEPNKLYASRGSLASSNTSINQSEAIYNLVWSPLEKYLDNIETVYFSTVGLLNRVAFAALTDNKNILIEKYNLNQLSSTYEITKKPINIKPDSTLFLGGITYNYTSKIKENIVTNVSTDLIALNSKRSNSNKNTSWNYLPGTLKEVNRLETIYSQNNIPNQKLIEESATETAFKSLSGHSPKVIHIATHGFFFEQKNDKVKSLSPIKNQYTLDSNPLKRCGLLLYGANYAWLNGGNIYEIDNGILTANEISNLDLSDTEMVVLSACETGLGDIDGSEGVYGLQRAFKMAGVDIIIMSLWEVPDAETTDFMINFYTNWLSGQQVRKAFRNTQLYMAETYKDHPEKWAAFVLFE